MELSHFGLSCDPFVRSREVDELCLPSGHAEIVRRLLADLDTAPGVSLVEGEPGVGTSLIARVFGASLGRDTAIAWIGARGVAGELLRELLDQLDPRSGPYPDGATALALVGEATAARRASGLRTAIVIDDAHLASPQDLAAVVAISAHCFLFGQPVRPPVRYVGHVRTYRVPRLAREDALAYVVDRLAAAGGRAHAIFTGPALSRIVTLAEGRLNRLEDLTAACLDEGAAHGAYEIGTEIVASVSTRADSGGGRGGAEAAPETPSAEAAPPEDSADGDEREYFERSAPWEPEETASGPEEASISVAAELEPYPSPAPPRDYFLREPSDRRRRTRAWFLAVGAISTAAALSVLGFRMLPGRSATVASESSGPASLPAETTIAIPWTAPPADYAPPGPEPVPEASASVVADPPATTSLAYAVQVGAFSRRANAEAVLRDLLRWDEQAALVEEGHVVVVMTRAVETRGDAEEIERRLRREGFSTYVRRLP